MTNLSPAERVLVLDTETTGLSAASRIVEIAAIEVDPRTGRTGSQLHHVVNPMVPIPPVVARIHGIHDRDVRGKPPFASIAAEVAAFLRGATVAIQNARFDQRILDAELGRAGQPPLGRLAARIVDTLDVSRGVFPLQQSHSLDSICDRVAVDRAARSPHGALVDARLLAQTLPKFAVEYDAWCAIAEDDCARDLDGFEGDLQRLRDDLATPRTESAEGADRFFSRVATATSWMRRCEDALESRSAALVDGDGWCCKHYVARWVSSESVSWKEAATAYLSDADLAAFRRESRVRVLTARPDAAVAAQLAGMQPVLELPDVVASISCVVRARLLLRGARAILEAGRRDARDVLLGHVDDGYVPRDATLTDGIRASIGYRAAMAALVREADLEPYTRRRRGLRVGRRDPSSCAALFG